MPLRELLLRSSSFNAMLGKYEIDPADFIIKDEDIIVETRRLLKEDVFRERILIQAKNSKGKFSLIGTLYCNLKTDIAVFEPDGTEAELRFV